MPKLCQLFYVSTATDGSNSAAVQSILQISRRNNQRLDITGCLLFSGRYFAQVLEGPSAVVAALAARIREDTRHHDVRVLSQVFSDRRQYAEWSMGYLHDVGLEDELERLLAAPDEAPAHLARLVLRMKPDSVMGALH
jgi:hypothetical protein